MSEAARCVICGFPSIRGLRTAMTPLPSGERIHIDAKTCKALQLDTRLREKVVRVYGEPVIPDPLSTS